MPQYFTNKGLLYVREGNPDNTEIPADAIECSDRDVAAALKICNSLSSIDLLNVENNIVFSFIDYFNVIKPTPDNTSDKV